MALLRPQCSCLSVPSRKALVATDIFVLRCVGPGVPAPRRWGSLGQHHVCSLAAPWPWVCCLWPGLLLWPREAGDQVGPASRALRPHPGLSWGGRLL